MGPHQLLVDQLHLATCDVWQSLAQIKTLPHQAGPELETTGVQDASST